MLQENQQQTSKKLKANITCFTQSNEDRSIN